MKVRLVVSALIAIVWSGCASPDAEREADEESTLHGPPSGEASAPRGSGSEDPVRTEILAGSTPLAVKIHPEDWSDIEKGVGTVGEALPLGPRLGSVLERVRRRGVFGALGRELEGFGELEHLEADRPVYLRADVLGAGEYLQAARVGLPVPPPDGEGRYPAGPRMRLLLPTQRPRALADEIEAIWQESEGEAEREVVGEEGFVRVEIFWPNREYVGESRVAELAEEMLERPGGEPEGRTAALEQFRGSEAPVAVYTDAGDLQRWYLAQTGLDAATASAGASGEDRRRIAIRASAATTGVNLMALRSARSFDDYAIRVEGDGEGGLTITGTGVRTELGSRLGRLANASGELPGWTERSAPESRLAVDLRFARDFEALERTAPGAVEVVGPDAPLSSAEALGAISRASGLGAVLGAVQSPEHLAHVGAFWVRDRYRVPPPTVLRLRLAGAGEGSEGPACGGVQALFNLGDSEPERKRRFEAIDGHLRAIPRGGAVEWRGELERRDDGMGRLTIGLERPLEELFAGETARRVEGETSFRAVPARFVSVLKEYGVSEPMLQAFGGLAEVPPVTFETASSPRRLRFRLAVGGSASESLEVGEGSGELREVEPESACLDRLTVAVHEFKRALESTDPTDLGVQQRLAERFASKLPACREAGEISEEYLGRVEGRAMWLLAWRAEVVLGDQTESIARCRPGEREAELRGASCLERALARSSGKRSEGLRRAAKVAEAMYRRACERGDEAACGSAELFTVPEE